MILEDFGYTQSIADYCTCNNPNAFALGRVVSEHKERYFVKTADKEYNAEIIGNMRYAAHSRADFPAVGDWVFFTEYEDNKGLIHHILPRTTVLERQAVGKYGEKQIIATNIDSAFIVQAADRDFNINRFQRYIAICSASAVNPILLLTKTDLVGEDELRCYTNEIGQKLANFPLFLVSNTTKKGLELLAENIEKGKTYCLMGSSGVGKSTLLNNLLGDYAMKTNTISISTSKGRHSTTHRQLFVLDKGGIVVDTPGMRELGVVEATLGIEGAFEYIAELSVYCKFKDCTHSNESGCAVLQALENGSLHKQTYENYMKLERERAHFESSITDKRKKEKQFGKMVKLYKKNRY